jgi:hypothetical protein
MSSIAYRLDRALEGLKGQGLTPVTLILTEADHEALARIGDWPVTTTARGELRFRSVPVFKARAGEAGSLVGRAINGSTRRLPFDAGEPEPAAGGETDAGRSAERLL